MAWRGVEKGGRAGDTAASACPAQTDLERWSLVVDEGRQVWEYVDEAKKRSMPDPVSSRYHVGLSIDHFVKQTPITSVTSSLRQAITFFSAVQTRDGHWAGDYGGPMFLLPGYAIATYITKTPVPDYIKAEVIRYLTNMQNPDGGWGIHIESESTVFGAALNYCVMRIFGVPASDPRLVRVRDWLKPRRGCLGIPSWGKFWLAVLNVYSWKGVHSLFPEMVLLPEWFPLHTRRMWSYCRTVYMPMSYLFGHKFQAPEDDLIRSLREELIFEPYDQVDWPSVRSFIAKEDLYTPHTLPLKLFYKIVNLYEHVAPSWLRSRALKWCYAVLEKEDEFSNYIDIGPVNKVINMLATWLEKGPDSAEFKLHQSRLPDYLWMGRDGMKMNGTNGSQLWDTSFMVQALIESGMKDEFKDVFRKAHDFIDLTQIRKNHPEHSKYYRDETKGGWPFSTRDMGWLVADCTGEGLKGALICKKHNYTATPLSDERLFDAVNILLLMQNDTGGYATCEKTRGWHFFEWFNASEVFGEIMIDYDYVECSSSALQGLCMFSKMYPDHRRKEVDRAIKKGLDFMLSIQRPDGSWEGMWGVCFTYGTWFGLEGLIEAGLPPTHPAVQKACQFLLSKQEADGGWGETFMSCVTREYVHHPTSQVVNTAWAVLSLMKAHCSDIEAIRRGIRFLIQRQRPSGDWLQESISGVFNKNCMISYSNYKNIFPIWALGRFTEMYPEDPLLKSL
eukprot:m.10868 g.10868  ORF g.10868 m.10868 type:complete len:730 (-) comp5338_c1_seq1:40-2229(-)